MVKRRKNWSVSAVISALLGLTCALVLAVLFYGTMVYQLAGDGESAQSIAPSGGVLALTGATLMGEETAQQEVGGALYSVITRTYRLASGEEARAVTASPAAYLEVLTRPGVTMQLITGFVIDDLDAVYAISGDVGILAARAGDTVYLIESAIDQQTLYALGASCARPTSEEGS